MSLKTVTVGSADVLAHLLSDPSAAGNLASVLSVADAKSLAGLFALVSQNAGLLLNAGGTYDIARSAIGTTGIPSVNTEGVKTTYGFGIVQFTPVATATDFFEIVGSGTKTVRVLWIRMSAFATNGICKDIQLIKRSTANSGGTKASVTIVPHDSNDAAATATVNSYSVNPTLGTTIGNLRAKMMNLGVAGAAGEAFWDFTTRNDKGLVLRGTSQQVSLNFNGAAVPSGMIASIEGEFTEE